MLKNEFLDETILDFFERIIAQEMNKILPGGKRWVTLEELENLIPISRDKILEEIRNGKIRPTFIGETKMLDYSEICVLLENNKFEISRNEFIKEYK